MLINITLFFIITLIFWWPMWNILCDAFYESNDDKFDNFNEFDNKFIGIILLSPIQWFIHIILLLNYFLNRENKQTTYKNFLINKINKIQKNRL